MKLIEDMKVNLKVLQWLLAHKEALLRIVEIAKGYNKTMPFAKQWEIVDQIARIVIPILEEEAVSPNALAHDDVYNYLWEEEEDTVNREVQILRAGVDVSAMAIDWKVVVDTVIPLVIAILQALLRDKK
jgi:hypothetical protein